MCGIIGYIGKNNAIPYLKDGLKNLEYRGYDSAGISFFDNGELKTIKKAGTVENLFNYVPRLTKTNVGIGHTRWATHGKPNDENSHPHSSFYNKVSLVHNGIIENYKKLLIENLGNIKLKSETDTEVIANLIEKYSILLGDNLKGIFETTKLLKGSYALAILFQNDSEKIYFAKNKSPLLIGLGENQNFVSSDILGFGNGAKNFVDVDDFEFGYITKDSYKIFGANFNEMTKSEIAVPIDRKDVTKENYPFFMIKEINEIPKIICDTANFYQNTDNLSNILSSKAFFNIKRIHLIGCGTSFHACLFGENLLRENEFDASSHIASEFICSAQPINEQSLCIFVSQSGETADTISAVNLAKKLKAKTLGITNVMTSTISKICDFTLPIKCGAEIAVASTKAFNGQLCSFIFLSELLKNYKNVKDLSKSLSNEAEKLKKVISFINIPKFEESIKPLEKEILSAKNIFMLGKNVDSTLAMESALKLKEISYLSAEAYPSGELKHGTIALVDDETLIFAFLTEKELVQKTLNVVRETQCRGAKIVAVSQFDEILNDNSIDFKIPLPNIDEKILPIISIVPMQLLAYHISVAMGHNPDKPRNLAKSVTVE